MKTLHNAIKNGDVKIVESLIKAGADIDTKCGKHESALLLAIDCENEEIVKSLIRAGADVNALGEKFERALQKAVYSENSEIVKILLDAGADVSGSGEKNGSALHSAAFNGDSATVKFLLDAGADVNASGGKYGSALQAAVRYGSFEIVKILLNAGADVNAPGGNYGSALQAAVYYGSIEIVKIFLDAGADVNVSGGKYGNALQVAARDGNIEIVKIFLDAGADVNASGGKYGSALQATVASPDIWNKAKSEKVMEILIKAGADFNVLGGPHGSVLQAAVAGATHWKDLIKLLLKKESGVVLQSRAIDGSSLLHAAVASGEQDVLNDLCNAGAKNLINVKNSLGQTPIHLAAMSSNLQILEKLYSLSAGSNSTLEQIDLDGRTCLHLAVEKEEAKNVKWLLDKGVKADSRDFGDSMPFQQAYQQENFEILCLLFPKIAEDQDKLSASQWRSVRPKNSGPVIMITNDELATVKTMSKTELSQYFFERSYDPGNSIEYENLLVTEKTMAENASRKVIL